MTPSLRLLVSCLFALACGLFQLSKAQNLVTLAGGAGDERFNTVVQLSDSTVLVGGSAQDLAWLDASIPRTTLGVPSYLQSTSPNIAFILRLSKDLRTIIKAYQLPQGTADNVYKIRTTNTPGQPTGDIYISGRREFSTFPGYYIARLDGNFVNAEPTSLTWVYNVDGPDRRGAGTDILYPPGGQSIVTQWQPWDVGGDGGVVYATGNDYSFDRTTLGKLNPDGREGLMPYWPIHRLGRNGAGRNFVGIPSTSYVNTTGDTSRNLTSSFVWLKYRGTGQKGNLRSYNQDLFNYITSDENGNPGRKGFYPTDLFFSKPEDLLPGTPVNTDAPGYTGLSTGGGNAWTPRLSTITIDRRNNSIYIGLTLRDDNQTSTGLPNTTDTEPSVLAMNYQGQNLWWARLHQETPQNSPIQQSVDHLDIDYANNLLAVVARCRGNVPFNFWSGDALTLNPGGTGFQNRLTGQIQSDNNADDFSWIGKYRLADGKIAFSTFVAGLSQNGNQGGLPNSNPKLAQWPDFNQSQPDLAQTRVNDVHVDAITGEVVIAGYAVRFPTTRDAYQESHPFPGKPLGGFTTSAGFVARYASDLSTIKYSSLLTGFYNPLNGQFGDNTYLTRVFPTGAGTFVAGYHTGVANKVITVNKPTWGVDSISGETPLLALLQPKTLDTSLGGPGTCLGRSVAFVGDTCGATVTLRVPACQVASRYVWVVNGPWSGSSTGNTITLTRTNATGGGYVTVSAVSGDKLTLSQAVALPSTLSPASPIPLAIPPSQCANTTQSYAFNPVNGAVKYRFTLAGPGCAAYTLDSAYHTRPAARITVSNATDACSLSVQSISCGGVSLATSVPLPFPSAAAPDVPSLIGALPGFCLGTARSLTFQSDANASDYIYSISGNGWSVNGNGPTVSVRADSAGATGVLTIQAIGSCGAGSTLTLNLPAPAAGGVPAAPTAIVTPDPIPCGGTAGRYSVDSSLAGVTYTFASTNSAYTVVSSGIANTVFQAPNSGGTTTLTVTASNGCGTSSIYSQVVRFGVPPAVGTITPRVTTLCAGSSQVLTVQPVQGAISYTWTLPAGLTGTSDSTRIIVQVDAAFSGGTVSVTANNSCGSSAAQNANNTLVLGVAQQPNVTVAINPNTQTVVCQGIFNSYWVTGASTSSTTRIDWTLPNGWYFSNGSYQTPDNDTILVTPTTSARPGLLRVIVSDVGLCGTATLSITPGGLTQPGSVSGPTQVCAGTPSVDYSVVGGTPSLGYNFSVNPSNAGTITQTGNQATFVPAAGFTGTVSIQAATSACGAVVQANPLQTLFGGRPNASFSGVDTSYCAPPGNLILTSVQPGGSYFLNRVPVSGGQINLSTPGLYVVKYVIGTGSCVDSSLVTVRVRSITRPTFTVPTDSLCLGLLPYTITDASPAGGVFSGPFITGNVFNPANPQPGQVFRIKYTVSSGTCSDSAFKTIVLRNSGTVAFARPIDSVCQNVGSYQLTGALPAGGTYSSTTLGVSASGLVTVLASQAGQTFSITYTTAGACTATGTQQLFVQALPDVTLSGPDTVCFSNGPLQINASIAGGTFSGSGVSSTGLLTYTQGGSYTITYTLIQGPCTGTASKVVVVRPAVDAPVIIAPDSACANVGVQLSATPSGGVFSGNGVSTTGLFNPSTLGQDTVRYTVGAGACTATALKVIYVKASSQSSIAGIDALCSTAQPVQLSASPPGGVFSGNGISASGLFTPSAGSSTITYTVSGAACTAQSTLSIVVSTPTRANAGPDVSLCAGGTVQLTASPAGGVWSGTGIDANGKVDGSSAQAGQILTLLYTPQGSCTLPDTVLVTIVPKPVLQNSTSTITVPSGQATAPFGITLPQNAQSLVWSPSLGLSNRNIATPTATVTSSTRFVLTAVFDGGCSDTTSVAVLVIAPTAGKEVFIPNGFTPNGDGEHDTWEIGNLASFPNNSVIVYNRYGTKVYSKDGYANDWDGGNLPAATYYYVLDVKDGSAKRTGSLTILR